MVLGLTLPYSQRDPQAVLAALKQQLNTLTNGDWTDFTENDLGYALIKGHVAINDFGAFFVDQQAAEGFLSTCTLRESAVRIAKQLNYVPRSVAPSTCTATLTFPAFNSEVNIPANSVWSINNITFTCRDPLVIPTGQQSLQISLTQGTPYSQTYSGTGDFWYKITVPANLAALVIKVNNVTWSAVDSFIDVSDPKSYRVYEDTSGPKTILFGSNLSTYAPQSGDTISISGVLTAGLAGNIEASAQTVLPISVIRDSSNNNITNAFNGVTTSNALGGSDVESLQSIKQNAPALYATGTPHRVVTDFDYDAIVRAIPGVTAVKTVGGEEIGPAYYGYVFVTVYGADPNNVTTDFLNHVKAELSPLCVTATRPGLIVQGPNIVQVSLALTIGILSSVYSDASIAINAINTALNTLISDLGIGGGFGGLFGSEVDATVQNLGGIVFNDFEISLQSSATSQAGSIIIQLCSNPDLTNAVLKDNSGNVIVSGDLTQYLSAGSLKVSKQGLTDQKCTVTYKPTGDNVRISPSQLIVLQHLTVSPSYVQ